MPMAARITANTAKKATRAAYMRGLTSKSPTYCSMVLAADTAWLGSTSWMARRTAAACALASPAVRTTSVVM